VFRGCFSLPARVELFGETDQVFEHNLLPIIGDETAIVAPEHLVHLSENRAEFHAGGGLLEGRQGHVLAAFRIVEIPPLLMRCSRRFVTGERRWIFPITIMRNGMGADISMD
jgi:hypothetical protein